VSVIPLYDLGQPFYVPAFEVKVTGASALASGTGPATPLNRDVVKDVIEATYQDSIDKVDSFTLVFNNWDADARTPLFLGTPPPKGSSGPTARSKQLFDLIKPGNTLQLLMGYQGPKPDLRVMTTGVIQTLEADFPEASAPRLTVRGLNVLDRFKNKQFTWAWPSDPKRTITDSEIAKELGKNKADSPPGQPGLGIEVRTADVKEPPLNYVMMNNQYPIVFLMDRARRNGYDVFLKREGEKQVLYFGPSNRVADRTYKLEWGKSLVSFKPTISLARQVSKVTVLGWDRKTKKPIKATASLSDPEVQKVNKDMHPFITSIGREEVVADRPLDTGAQADKIAREYLRAQVQDLVEATGVVVGLPDLRAGRKVEIGGFDPLLNGTWFLKETTHTINDTGYRTTFVARREEPAK
jgi:phage protein D